MKRWTGALLLVSGLQVSSAVAQVGDGPEMPAGYSIPVLDLAGQEHRQVVVDKEPGQYLGHPRRRC